ncbi:hypothetical protein SAMN06269185_0322 [Natronoarchaeum philippinense]|uniref:Uncharacterized protein n=1 Tax=Natronoarchaeum philippinense TaxID=558529 RepID=A0A285N2B8_NATPI|nr:hypothetical protein SAMN06269185_0322 [Natronoarchaeum philippinense]
MSGGRPQQVDDDQILECFLEADSPVLTTAEVASDLPISQRAILDRLSSLSQRDILVEKDVGQSGCVWWLKSITWHYPSIHRDSSIASQLDPEKPHGTRVAVHDWTNMDQYLAIQPEERYEPRVQDRQRAVRAAYEYLSDKGRPVSKREFIYDVWPSHQAGYETPTTWWQELIRPHFSAVDTIQLTDSQEWTLKDP